VDTEFDVAVLGAGVAGLASSVELARLGHRVVVLDRLGPGGQVMNAGSLGHVPGIEDEVRGSDLVGRIVDQAISREVRIEFGDVNRLALRENGFEVTFDSGELAVLGVVAALGARDASLGIPGEERFEGRGVSHCAQCDGDMFAGGDVAVVGGGDTALEAAAHLAQRTRHVTIVHRGSTFSAARELGEAGLSPDNVDVRWQSEVLTIDGDDRVRSVQVQSKGTLDTIAIDGVFLAVGSVAQNEPLLDVVTLDPKGRLPVDARLATAVPGLYAAGMCRTNSGDQISTALGDGVMAARELHRWLEGR
jgi:thioredoxin reductase (NADPH)